MYRPYIRSVPVSDITELNHFIICFTLQIRDNNDVFQSCAACLFTAFRVTSLLITSFYLSFGLPVFRCPCTSTFHVVIIVILHLFMLFSPHDLHNHKNISQNESNGNNNIKNSCNDYELTVVDYY